MYLSEVMWGNADILDAQRERMQEKTLSGKSKIQLHPYTRPNRTLPKFEKILNKMNEAGICVQYHSHLVAKQNWDWLSVPKGLDPLDGGLCELRAFRKRQQIDNLLVAAEILISSLLSSTRKKLTVVEFCAGSGYVALPLAYKFPRCKFVLLDMKERSLRIAKRRIDSAGLTNVEIINGLVQDFTGSFDLGIALHACGEATDFVMEKCLEERAMYLMCPCCVGKIQHSILEYPRSAKFRRMLGNDDYNYLESEKRRRYAKCYVERDRNMRAEDTSYTTKMFIMQPNTCTPKNDIILGWPNESQGCKFLEDAFPMLLRDKSLEEILF